MGDEGELGLEPWEHHPGEHPRNYHVFEIFCHLGWDRSVRKAAEKGYAETGHSAPKNPGARFSQIAIRDRWQERADCYWRQERRRAEHLLHSRRDQLSERFMLLGEKTLGKYELAFSKLDPHKNGKSYIEGIAKLKELRDPLDVRLPVLVRIEFAERRLVLPERLFAQEHEALRELVAP